MLGIVQMEKDGRIVDGAKIKNERENIALRPKLLSDIVGQDRVKDNLQIMIEAAKKRQDPIDHILFYGPPV
jgi:Holliday junction DNA helicase RuvB